MTYREKVDEARALRIDSTPDATKYPLIFGEVGVTAADAVGVATIILDRYTAWKDVGAVIERLRLKAKMAIAAATDEPSMRVIINAVAWP